MPKVFIIYPHNPEPYLWKSPTDAKEFRFQYPEKSAAEIAEMQLQEVQVMRQTEKRKVMEHNQLVDTFAKFLIKNGVDVAHEGLWQDESTLNYMRRFQEELYTSDFIILIVTKSFHHFLSNQTFPPGEEKIFEGEFLHNLIHKSNKPILPVFLDCPKDLVLLPDALRSSSTYHVGTPAFSLLHSEMDSLYAVLTGQNRCAKPLPGPRVKVAEVKRCKFAIRLDHIVPHICWHREN